MPEKNTQSRKWILVINNPQVCGLDHEKIQSQLALFQPEYYCLADEIAQTGTYHTHIFIYSKAPIRFGTLKNRFPVAHIEKSMGSARDNRDYIKKEGKWADTGKAETSVAGTFKEFGTVPSTSAEKSPKMHDLLEKVKAGYTNTEIIDENPAFGFDVQRIDVLRDTYLTERFRIVNREVEVIYVYGAPGTGKTRDIYVKHGAENICRITDYNIKNGIRFDAYHGQDVLVFEEFYSQIAIEAMLNYLDVYPINLPARYNDRIACFTKVYITSNTPLHAQYTEVQYDRIDTWLAFLRRIHHVYHYYLNSPPEEEDKEGHTLI